VDTQTLIRLIIGLLMTAIVLVFAAKRVLWLATLVTAGQPVGEESGRTDHMGERIGTQVKEVFAQTRMLRWSIPGLAHFFTMWGFFILITVYIEAYGVLFDPKFHIPVVGRWEVLGFLQDFIALGVLLGITTFAIIRLRTEPKEHGRSSRFYGSHTGGAWLILFMIFLVIFTFAFFRGAAVNTGNFPYGWGAFFSHGMSLLLKPLGLTANEWIETGALLAHIADFIRSDERTHVRKGQTILRTMTDMSMQELELKTNTEITRAIHTLTTELVSLVDVPHWFTQYALSVAAAGVGVNASLAVLAGGFVGGGMGEDHERRAHPADGGHAGAGHHHYARPGGLAHG